MRHGSNSDDCWNSLQQRAALVILRGTEPVSAVSALTRALLILLYLFFFYFISSEPLAISRWQSCKINVNLKTTIGLPLFWRTWTRAARARARTRPHVLAWHMGSDYSDCRALELTDSQVSGFVHFWFLENTEKMNSPEETFLRLMPLTALVLSHIQFWLPLQSCINLNFIVISESRHCRLLLTSSSSV